MRHHAARAAVEHGVVPLQPLRQVVRGEDRHLRRAREPLRAHHADVGVGDGQDAGAAEGRGADRAVARFRPGLGVHRMVRQVRREMRGDADRPDAGPAAAMRDAEGLVEVEVAHVGADRRRRGQPHLRVHVGAVHVDLAAVLVDQRADLADALLEHAVRARIGHHQRRQPRRMLLRLGAEVGEVHVAVAVAGDHDDLHPRHHRARRIGAVRGGGDQAHVALRLAPRAVPGADRQQARVLALAAGIGLERDGGEARRRAEPIREPPRELRIALRLVRRREGMRVREAGKGHRHHLGGGVQLHGAGAERDHAAVQRHVAVFQPLEVAQHRVLAAVGVEHLGREEGRAPRQRRRQLRRRREVRQRRHRRARRFGDRRGQRRQLLARHRLVQAHAPRSPRPRGAG